jgi:hypothetical protein
LKLKEISPELRAYLWEAIHRSLMSAGYHDGPYYRFDEPWGTLLYQRHILRDHRMVEDFDNWDSKIVPQLRAIYEKGDYLSVLGLTQWFLRNESCPDDLQAAIGAALDGARAAYKLVDGDALVPISSEEEAGAVSKALEATQTDEGFGGPRAHLKTAAQELADGKWADSIRESVHAVEAAARIIEPKAGTLGPALSALEKRGILHSAMQKGFSALYGFTSDEKGIRHSLMEKGSAKVDEETRNSRSALVRRSCPTFSQGQGRSPERQFRDTIPN